MQRRHIGFFLFMLVGMIIFGIETIEAGSKTVSPKRVKEIYQEILYTYTDNTGKSVTKSVNEPVACSLHGCEEHTKKHIEEGLRKQQAIGQIVQCKSGSDLYQIKVPVKSIENKRVITDYKTLQELKFYSMQGSCYHGGHLYIAFSDKGKSPSSTEIKNKTKVKSVNLTAVVKLAFRNKAYQVAQVEVIKGMEQMEDVINYMGHANDMTFANGKLHTTWYEVINGKNKKKKFTLGYIDLEGQVKGLAVAIGNRKDSKQKTVFGIASYKNSSHDFAVGIRDSGGKSKKRYVELYRYKKRSSSRFKYQYVRKKKLFDIQKGKYPITQCMTGSGKYIYINKYKDGKKGHNNCIQIYKNNKYKDTRVIQDPTITKPDGKKQSLKSRKWEIEGFGKIVGKNRFYCVMAMPLPEGEGKLLEKKQAYLCTLTIKHKK